MKSLFRLVFTFLLSCLLTSLFAMSACVTIRPRTEVVVLVRADATIASDTRTLRVTVEGGVDHMHYDSMPFVESLDSPEFPLRVSVSPVAQDATRVLRVSVEARDASGNVIGRYRLRTRYIPSQTGFVEVLLTECCRSVASMCGSDERCAGCVCRPIIDEVPVTDAGPADLDAGMPLPDANADTASDAPRGPDAFFEGDAFTCPAAMLGLDCRAPNPCEIGRTQCVRGAVECVGAGPKPSGASCRASRGVCDPAETCDGVSLLCPADAHASPTFVCRAAVGPCDVDDTCGGADACGADERAPVGRTCPGGFCDADGACTSGCTPGGSCEIPGNPCTLGTITCSGGTPSCVPSGAAPPSTECRPAAGPCDIAEVCGGATTCPLDTFSTGVCRIAAGVCDVPEMCSGSSAMCPVVDALAGPSVVCRAAVPGVGAASCDIEERCTGGSVACPTDLVAPSSTVCRPALLGDCAAAENCDGANPVCPPDEGAPDGTSCFNSTRCDRCLGGVCEGCTGGDICCPDTTCSDRCA